MGLKLKKLSTNGGYLENSPISFADGLTCIIGARGTCKSTVVETIRFLFRCGETSRIDELLAEPDDAEFEVPSHKGLLRETLQDSVARCELSFDDEAFVLEREINASEPRLYKDGVKELLDKRVMDFIEIYSQGELQGIAEDGKRRLELIDRPNKTKIDGLKEKQETAAEELENLGNTIRNIKAGIESRRAEIKALDLYRQQLSEIKKSTPPLSTELELERQRFTERTALLDQSNSLVKERAGILEKLRQIGDSDAFGRYADKLQSVGQPPADELGVLFSEFSRFLSTVRAQTESQPGIDQTLLERLKTTFEEQNQAYYELRRRESDLNDSLRAQDRIRQQILILEQREAEVQSSQLELQNMHEKRARLRQEVLQHSETIFNLRIAQVEDVNKQFFSHVLLDLQQGTRSTSYKNRIKSLLEGSRLRNKSDIAEELAAKISPSELIDVVEAGDSNRLAELLDRDLGQMARLVSYLGDSQELYKLESEVFDDELSITFFDEGTPKRVDQLSKGQKATAILPLILRGADYPLIFDQPEDDLDNRFIYEHLVEMIQTLKLKRQLIFVTHNANIPVLGDAEKVLVMSMKNPHKAAVPQQGSVDEVKVQILSLLEGGAEAFTRRQKRYGPLLNKSEI